MTLDILKNALEATGYPVAHYAWSDHPSGTYLIYAEDDATHIFADDHMVGQALQGTVDLFTRDDSDAPREAVQTQLDSISIPWYLSSVQYEEETGFIHYEWIFEVVVDG